MRLHHVQLTMPRGGEPRARSFYGDVLGMAEMEKPSDLAGRGGCWFRKDDVELHLAAEEPFHPAQRGHPGFVVDDLDAVSEALRTAGHPVEADDLFPGHRRLYALDPFGNRLELLQPRLAPDEIAVAPLAAGDCAGWSADVVRVYAAAFAPPPYRRGPAQIQTFGSTLHRHVGRRGFVAFGARDPGGRLVGFTYGYSTERGQWWHEQVRAALGSLADRWLNDAFEYVELAVDPGHRRLGIGRRLHDLLVDAQRHPRAVLTTLDDVTAGRRLYERSGWRVLAGGFRFERTTARYAVMGLEPARPVT